MVQISSDETNFIFEIKGHHKIWALKSKIIVPKKDIVSVIQDKEKIPFWKGIRMPGTEIPWLFAAGTFYDNGRNFWDVYRKNNTIIVELKDHYYKKLYIEVKNPIESLQLLNTK